MSDRTECTKDATYTSVWTGKKVFDTPRLQECAYDYPGPFKVKPQAKDRSVFEELWYDVEKLFGQAQ